MKARDIHTEIKRLKVAILDNTIPIDDAIDQFMELLEEFQETDTSVYCIAYEENNPIVKELQERNQRVLDRIKKLNRILVLQELGVHFTTEELNVVLQRNR